MRDKKPCLIAFTTTSADQERIRSVASTLGYRVEVVASGERFGDDQRPQRPGEQVSGGQLTELTRFVSQQQPRLVLVDADSADIPTALWTAVIRSSPATRRIPIIAYYSTSADVAAEAKRGGADVVVPRAHCLGRLPQLIKKHAVQHDAAAIASACQSPLSQKALDGIALFNERRFYDAHHGLEDAWNDDKGAARELYRAILQVAVAYLQIERGNFRGASKMFLRVRQWLAPLPSRCRGVDIDQLRADSAAAEAHLHALGADQIAAFDRAYFKPLQVASTST